MVPISPTVLSAILGAAASNNRARRGTSRLLAAAAGAQGTWRGACLFPPLDAIAFTLEAITAMGMGSSRKEAFAQHLGSGSSSAGSAGSASSVGGRIRSHPIDMLTVKTLLGRIDKWCLPNGRIFAAVSHACLRAGSTARAADVLRLALAMQTMPPEYAFRRLLREVVSLEREGLFRAPAGTLGAAAAGHTPSPNPTFRLLAVVDGRNSARHVSGVQEVVELLKQAGCVGCCVFFFFFAPFSPRPPPPFSLAMQKQCSSKGVSATVPTAATWTSVPPERAAEHKSNFGLTREDPSPPTQGIL